MAESDEAEQTTEGSDISGRNTGSDLCQTVDNTTPLYRSRPPPGFRPSGCGPVAMVTTFGFQARFYPGGRVHRSKLDVKELTWELGADEEYVPARAAGVDEVNHSLAPARPRFIRIVQPGPDSLNREILQLSASLLRHTLQGWRNPSLRLNEQIKRNLQKRNQLWFNSIPSGRSTR